MRPLCLDETPRGQRAGADGQGQIREAQHLGRDLRALPAHRWRWRWGRPVPQALPKLGPNLPASAPAAAPKRVSWGHVLSPGRRGWRGGGRPLSSASRPEGEPVGQRPSSAQRPGQGPLPAPHPCSAVPPPAMLPLPVCLSGLGPDWRLCRGALPSAPYLPSSRTVRAAARVLGPHGSDGALLPQARSLSWPPVP